MSIIKDLFTYFILALMIYYFFKCSYLKTELFNQRENFIEILGHDFRVPLIAQIRGLDYVQQNFNLPHFENSFVEEINNSCKYTLEMISMLLKIYKFENNNIFPNYEYTDISVIFPKIFEEFNKTAAEKNVKLQYTFENNIILTDKEDFTKAVKILINTALLYAKKNTTVNISSKKYEKKLILEVKYEGSSISDEEYKRMFSLNPVYSTVGQGIQMFLCKKIIDMHKGEISYTTKLKECSFIISIPQKYEYIPSEYRNLRLKCRQCKSV